MPDVQFLDLRNGGDGPDILISEAVPSVDFEAARCTVCSGVANGAQRLLAFSAGRVAIGTGVQLHHWRADRLRRIELFVVRFDEQRHANASIAQSLNNRREARALASGIDAAFGCPLLALLRHDARGVRAVLERD